MSLFLIVLFSFLSSSIDWHNNHVDIMFHYTKLSLCRSNIERSVAEKYEFELIEFAAFQVIVCLENHQHLIDTIE